MKSTSSRTALIENTNAKTTQIIAPTRRWELADGLGMAVNDGIVADWLAARPPRFLDDVSDSELVGSTFDSKEPPGTRRDDKNI